MNKILKKLLNNELKRQNDGLVMIPSENLASKSVLDLLGSCLNNKYAEGYPGKRYYSGNVFIDEIENLARDEVKKLFNYAHANVQPHSGSDANYASYSAIIQPGDKILSMSLSHGGHISHGLNVNFSGKLYEVHHYGVKEGTELIDYEEIEKLANEIRPKLIVSGATAYPRIIDFERISRIAHSIEAYHMADISHIAGLVCTDEHPRPIGADIVTFTTHKTMRGPRGAVILCTEELAQKVDRAVFPGLQGGPFEHVIAAKAQCFFEAGTEEFKEYQAQIRKNAKILEQEFSKAGIRMISGGTDNHLLLLDLRPMNVNGHDATLSLEKAGIYVNKNTIPFDPGTPFKPSGIRLGTPYLTSRGMKEKEMEEISGLIIEILKNPQDEELIKLIGQKVKQLTKGFPIYK